MCEDLTIEEIEVSDEYACAFSEGVMRAIDEYILKRIIDASAVPPELLDIQDWGEE